MSRPARRGLTRPASHATMRRRTHSPRKYLQWGSARHFKEHDVVQTVNKSSTLKHTDLCFLALDLLLKILHTKIAKTERAFKRTSATELTIKCINFTT